MNVFDLFAKISLDTSSYEKGLTSAKSRMSSFGDGLKGALGKAGDVFSSFAKGAAKSLAVVGTGVSAAGTALTGLAKKSLEAYADYEQLEGGVKKIFGEDTAKTVMKNANEAFSAAGLSANAYMETVTGFSASLLQSLDGDTEKAAEAANRAIIDMADNVNTYGTSMESVQNAYQGFAKQNYTMLDNLKLGYGGTKEEMQRLITDAAGMNEEMQKLGVTVDADSLSFGNIVNAISVMQEHMNIAGTTSKEAATTISGSIASAKAAWQNFLIGSGSAKQFTDALKIAAENVKAKAKDIVPGMIEGLTAIGDELAPEIPGLIEDLLPVVIDGSSNLLSGLAERTPDLVKTLLPSLASGTVDVTTALVGELPKLISALKETAPIVVKTIMEKKGELLQAGKDIISALFPQDFSKVGEIATSAVGMLGQLALKLTDPENIKIIVGTADDIVGGLIDGLLSQDSIDAFLENAPKLLSNIAEGITTALIGENKDGKGGIVGAANEIIDKLVKYFDDPNNRQKFYTAAGEMLKTLGQFLVDNVQVLVPFVAKLVGALAVMLWNMLNDALMNLLNSDYKLGAAGQYSDVLKEMYMTADTDLAFDPWISAGMPGLPDNEYNPPEIPQEWYTAKGMIQDTTGQIPWYAKERMKEAMGYASGFVVDRPTWLGGNTLVGEAGTEALIPLESNTQWMDTFADKLGARMGGGVVIEQIIINAPSGNAEDIQAAFLDSLDEALRNRQITQNRGIGAVVWQT